MLRRVVWQKITNAPETLYCLHLFAFIIALMKEAVSTSGTLVNLYQTKSERYQKTMLILATNTT